MKRNMNRMFIFVLVMAMMLALVGCAASNINSPEDAIKDAYGDAQFRISFDSTSLESPIADMFYTANNMPILPTPTKVGFVFAGWYFDASLTQPCDVQSGDLLWKMKNVTLYPKWEEEQIVNNGTYEIEYNAKIIEDTIVKGALADGYQKFPEDIIASETYIEKNDNGIFLRLQYDNVVRGPVLGGSGSDENNFSKMTYTVTDKEGRIRKDLSILDRTSNIQTIYYDLNGRNLDDIIVFNVEYYNWAKDISDDLRDKTSVRYDVAFNISRFIGFDQSFINPEGRLENGVYVIPTHYTSLDKEPSMLDMFNPVYSYIQAKDGKYKLYKPLNTYNNDVPVMTPDMYQLRNSGFAREFACFYINADKKIPYEIEEDISNKYYMPGVIGAEKYIPITYEFHADTGRYYYSVELGDALDNDLVFIGGSSGAMEQMFSNPFGYRRLKLDYTSMVRIAEWDYKPLSGDKYIYRQDAVFYPGSTEDFNDRNEDFDIYNQYLQAIDMTNVFFTKTSNNSVDKIFDTKMTISFNPTFYGNISENRYKYNLFDISLSAYGYNPLTDGDLYARDLTFITNSIYRRTNSNDSMCNKKINGKTYNIGDRVNLIELYKEKVKKEVPNNLQYTAYKLDDNFQIQLNSEFQIDENFKFHEDVAIFYTSNSANSNTSSIVYLVKKQDAQILINDDWHLDSNNIFVSDKRFAYGSKVNIPEILYSFYGETISTRSLYKELEKDEQGRTDFTTVSAWNYSQGVYSAKDITSTKGYDFIMDSEQIRVMVQVKNLFDEFETIILEFKGVNSGKYEININDKKLTSGDITYKGTIRNKISYKIKETFHIENEQNVLSLPKTIGLSLITDKETIANELTLSFAVIYSRNNTIKVNSIEEIWAKIKDEKYALVSMIYANDYGDTVEYKAEYNFKINNKLANNYYSIDENITVFDGQSFEIKNPFITSSDYIQLGVGEISLFKKYGDEYLPIKNEDGKYYSSKYYGTVTFNTSGEYLICWQFNLIYDENGDVVFDAVNPELSYTTIAFNICQNIIVYDRNSDANITYATDKEHPFDEAKKQELLSKGYVFSEDSKYQYASIFVKKGQDAWSLTYDNFVPKGHNLFGWGTNKGYRQYMPGYKVNDAVVVQNTLKPILYAIWNVGIKVDLTYDIDGIEIKPTNKELVIYRDKNENIYNSSCSIFSFKLPNEYKGYKIYGWQADKPVFTEFVEIDGKQTMLFTDHIKGGFNQTIIAKESFKLKAIFKKPIYLTYEAVDENGNKLTFTENIKSEHNLFVQDKLNEIISVEKLNRLNNAHVTDISKTLKYWTVYDHVENKYVIISDLSTFVLENKYININDGKRITLRAVFG